jgi:hypothetical protein
MSRRKVDEQETCEVCGVSYPRPHLPWCTPRAADGESHHDYEGDDGPPCPVCGEPGCRDCADA